MPLTEVGFGGGEGSLEPLALFFLPCFPRQADGQRAEDRPGATRDPRQTSELLAPGKGSKVSLRLSGAGGCTLLVITGTRSRTPGADHAGSGAPAPERRPLAWRPALQRPPRPSELRPPPGGAAWPAPHLGGLLGSVDTQSARVEEPTAPLLPAPARAPADLHHGHSSRRRRRSSHRRRTDKPPLLIQDGEGPAR